MINRRELLVDRTTGRSMPVVKETPVSTSSNSDWRGLLLEVHETPSFENNDVFFQNDTIFVHLSEPATLEWKDEKETFSKRLLPGHVSIIPRWMRHTARCNTANRFLMLSLDREFVADSVAEIGSSDKLELTSTYSQDDPFVRELCFALKAEVETGIRGGRLYGETLGTSLAVHLIEKYSSRNSGPQEFRGGLAKYKLRQVIEYIHSHIAGDFSLKTLADLVGLSQFHFTRMFKKSTGLPPHRYLIKCRVQHAKQLLLRSTESLANIAMQSGFCDQSHFTAHFKRAYGITPKTFIHQEVKREKLG